MGDAVVHVSEERNIPASPDAVWRVIADTMTWPRFYATPNERLHLRSVEFLDGATRDGEGVTRRLHFTGVPSWDEHATRWRERDGITWLGVRNPAMKYWNQQLEIVPGKGYCTLRWDVYFEMNAPRAVRKAFKRTMEDIVLSSLARIERLASEGD